MVTLTISDKSSSVNRLWKILSYISETSRFFVHTAYVLFVITNQKSLSNLTLSSTKSDFLYPVITPICHNFLTSAYCKDAPDIIFVNPDNKKAEADPRRPILRSSKVYLGLPRIRAAPTGRYKRLSWLTRPAVSQAATNPGNHILHFSS